MGFVWPSVASGGCQITDRDRCVTSPNYPSPYGHEQSCTVNVDRFSSLTVEDFHTEGTNQIGDNNICNNDVLTVNSVDYCGTGAYSWDIMPQDGIIVTNGLIEWRSDKWKYGDDDRSLRG